MNRIKRRLLLLKQYKRRLRLWIFAPIYVVGLFLLFGSQPVGATAKKSTLTISVDNPGMAFTVIGSSGGNFGKSGINTVTATTDNFTGYQLKIASVESRSFVNGDDDEIVPIDSEINETTFQNSALYNNKWGYVPSQFITTINEENTVIQNTNYLPAPSLEGDLLAITNAANTIADTYTLSFGARVDATLPTGSYEYTYVLQMVGNDVVYNVTFDKNTTETVTDMPVPNPQPLVMPGGTPTEQSYVALSDAVPIMTSGDELTFGGWCDEMTTLNTTTGNYECPGITYEAGADYPIDQTADGTNITLYAIWVSEVDPFPTVWSHMGACIFNGKTGGNITGSECTEYYDKQYIDTEVALYNDANYEKDYQVHFKIDSYNPSQQSSEKQQTFFNDKLSSKAGNKQSPGIVVRRESSSSKIEINSRLNDTPAAYSTNASDISTVDVYRINHMIYYSINSGPLVMLQDLTGSSEKFGINAWFGAYPYDEDCTVDCTKAKRFIDATMSEMFIKLGDFDESDLYKITFNGNGGTPSTDKYLITDGNALGDLPTAARSDWYFLGWFTEQSGGTQITKNTVPTATTTYWAHWVKTVAQAIITNPDITVPKDGTETINVSNANEVEPYTFSSTDPTIATVNSTTGEVTGVAVGSTTIIMTGTLSHDTRTINVTVSGSAVTLTFDADGGAAVEPVSVGQGATLGYIPASIKQGYILDGWYTGAGGTGQKLLTTTPINEDTLYYANWVAGSFVCEKAKSLHAETCTRSSNGCNLAGYGTGDTITYGQLIQTSTMNYGDAYNCDINGDNEFDETNERFYYIGVNSDNDNASLVYSKSLVNTDREYNPAITDLPTSSTWTNDKLTVFDGTRVGRFMKRSEVQRVCGSIQELPTNLGADGNCVFLMEQSSFSDTSMREGIWLEAEGDASSGANR